MSKALLKNIRLSPTKARLVARQVQGMNAELALVSLEFTPNKAAKLISKVIASAIANGGYEANGVVVHSCRIDAGPVLRRFMPRARGRATPIRKPTSHIFVEVMSQSEIDTLKSSTKSTKKIVTKTETNNTKKATKVESKSDSATNASKTNKANTTSTKETKVDSKAKMAQKTTTKSSKESNPKVSKVAKPTTKSKTNKKDEDK